MRKHPHEPIMPRRLLVNAVVVLFFLGMARADKERNSGPGPHPISQSARFEIIRALNGELVYVRKPFPMGTRGLIITPDGKLVPDGKELEQLVAINGPAAKVGERARITDLIIKEKLIIFEINGGPKHKRKWYHNLEVGGMGGMTPVAPQPDEMAKGSFVALQFDKFVPQMTPEQLKERLAGVFDFHAKTSLEAYVETIPPKAREAIAKHQVLVGMNRQMVLYSIGRPPRKLREKEDAIEYEEWIYGDPPQEVKFIRFVGDEVTRIEVMAVDGTKTVRTAKEIELGQETQQAAAKPAAAPARAPTLRRPGEEIEGTGLSGNPPPSGPPGNIPGPAGGPQPGDPGGPPQMPR